MRLGVVLTWAFVLFLLQTVSGCDSPTDAVDTSGLNQVQLRIEGMT